MINSLFKKFNVNVLTYVMLGLLTYFLFHSLYGPRGIIAYFKINQQIDKYIVELESLKLKRLQLEYNVSALRNKTLNLDLLDELARSTLGYIGPNEQMIVP